MFNKKILLGLMLFAVCPMDFASAETVNEISKNTNDEDSLYLRVGYQAAYVGSENIDSAIAVGPTIGGHSSIYNPKFAINFIGGNLALGRMLSQSNRVELEFAFNPQFEIDNADKINYFNDVVSNAIYADKGFNLGVAALNLYYDMESVQGLRGGLTPYFGGGVGIARVNFFSIPTSETVTYPIALQLKAGLQMQFNKTMPLYIGYKLVYLLPKEANDSINAFAGAGKTTKVKACYLLHNLDIGLIMRK